MTTQATADEQWVPRKAARGTDDLLLGGVASGLAQHLGLPVLWVRVAFILTAFLAGFGVMLYAGCWLVLPTDESFEESSPGAEAASRRGMRPRRGGGLRDVGPAIAVGVFGLGVVFFLQMVLGTSMLVWPVVLVTVGVALLWRQADEAQRERWIDTSGRIDPFRTVFGAGTWASYARVGAGIGLILLAWFFFVARSGSLFIAREVLIGGLLSIVGVAIVLGPWIWRLASDLTSERTERVRTQERADLAAHLHDSVLQTLALIQKNSGDQALVARLARSQERDLRTWLYSTPAEEASTVAGQLRLAAAVIEDAHGVSVDVVSVGDLPWSEQARPVVDATREAITNAAKHSGVAQVDVYAELSAGSIDVFVRDRGTGFDPDAVAADRHGVRRSIVDRMQRHGGTAQIVTAPGAGTEVRLHLPLEAGDPR